MLVSWLPDPNVTVLSDVAPANAPSPMLVTLAGMSMLVSAEPTNAASPMLVTLSGMVMLVSAVAPANAASPMLVTPSGISTAPTHDPPSFTTLFVIVNIGAELSATNGSPVVHSYAPLRSVACAGPRTSPDMTKTRVVNMVTSLPYLPSDFAALANKAVPPRDS